MRAPSARDRATSLPPYTGSASWTSARSARAQGRTQRRRLRDVAEPRGGHVTYACMKTGLPVGRMPRTICGRRPRRPLLRWHPVRRWRWALVLRTARRLAQQLPHRRPHGNGHLDRRRRCVHVRREQVAALRPQHSHLGSRPLLPVPDRPSTVSSITWPHSGRKHGDSATVRTDWSSARL
jgi:hypothetical protein